MEKTFRKMTKGKALTGFLSVLLMSFMLVSAAVYPNPFTDNNEANVAIVYGASAAATDSTAADNLMSSLANGIITPEELERILSAGVTEDEIELGTTITDNGNIKVTLTDNKITSLFDGRIDWDDGEDTDSYDVHEEIIIGDLNIKTTLDNNDFEGVVLTNNKGLEYKLVFEEDMFADRDLDDEDADTLDVSILGKDYSIEDVDGNSITITTAESIILASGDSTTIEGVTLTIDDVYTDSVSINGVYIEEGKKKTINGIKVQLDAVYYRDSDISSSKVKILAGGDISKEYSDGDAFIGQDDDDPEWVWSINNPGDKDGWIGVKYDLRQVDEDDDVVYEGEEYIFPNDFVTVSFDSLNDVDYSDYEVYFDNLDMYAKGSSGSNGAITYDVDIVVIKGENEDSFELGDGIETDTLYLQKVDANTVKVYYMDLAEDFSTGKPVYLEEISLLGVVDYSGDDCDFDTDCDVNDFALNGTFINGTLITNGTNNNTFTCSVDSNTTYNSISIVTLIADDTEMEVGLIGGDDITLSIGNIEISLGGGSSFLYLGATEEDAEDSDVIVSGKSIGNKDNDVMDHYGTVIESPESNTDDDKVVFKVPSEQVYAQVSVLGSEEDLTSEVADRPTPADLNITKITDESIATADGKNIIVVGGSCINTVATELLGGKFCGAEFTVNTGVSAGQVLIQTFDRGDGNVATLVAGFNAEDTVRGVQYLLNNNINIAVGEKVII